VPQLCRGTPSPHGAGSPRVPAGCPPSAGLSDSGVTEWASGRVSLQLGFFSLALGRKPESAVHKHRHPSPQPDKELKRWMGEGGNMLDSIYSFFPVWTDTRFCHVFRSF